jgi:UDP-glucose 4-epimerase
MRAASNSAIIALKLIDRQMKVFITGGTGFIGSYTVMELLNSGDEVTILARNPNKVPKFLDMPGVTLLKGELDDQEVIRTALPGHQACIHMALIWDVEPTELQLKDTRASVRLFEEAAGAGVEQMIYTSSTAVHRPFRNLMDEGDYLEPDDYYGATKAAAEAFLSAFSYRTGMRCNTVRPGPTVGMPAIEGGPIVTYRRIEQIAHAAILGEDIHVSKNDGRQFIWAGDLAKLYSAVLHSKANRETYLGVAKNYTLWEQIANDAVSLTGSKSRVVVNDNGAMPRIFDASKIARDFDFAFDSETALRDHLKYVVDSQSTWAPR